MTFSSSRWCRAAGLFVLLGCWLAGSAAAQTPDRSRPPAVGDLPALQPPAIESFTLDNGLRVLLVAKHEVPLVQVNLLVEAGSVDDPADAPGLAHLTAELLDEGAGERSALELADAFEFLGARFFVNPGDHWTTLGLRVPVGRLEPALALMADVALRPRFDDAELARLRLERLTALLRRHDEPTVVAGVLLAQTLYGADHPYGRGGLGTEAALRGMTTDAVRGFYHDYFRPQNATLVVVGDVTPEAAKAQLAAAFGTWKEGHGEAPPRRPVTPAEQVTGRTVYLVDKPGAAQSVIRIGRLGAARDTDDYYALEVMNTILGGSFTSRLNQNLREDKGYSYGAGSGFDYRRVPGPFQASASVFTAVTAPALTEFFRELDALHGDISQEEFERAKNFLVMRFPQGFQSVAQVAARVGELVQDDLPLDYYEDYTQHVRAVTLADVKAAANYVDPAHVAVVVVGDREAVEEELRALDLGALQVLEVTDVLGALPVLGTDSE